jgi:hypothetical protein
VGPSRYCGSGLYRKGETLSPKGRHRDRSEVGDADVKGLEVTDFLIQIPLYAPCLRLWKGGVRRDYSRDIEYEANWRSLSFFNGLSETAN